MSLKALLRWHYFTLQTSEFAGKDTSGAFNRKDSWLNEENGVNIKGHLQSTPTSSGRGKDDVITRFGKEEFEHYYTLFHNNTKLNISPDKRILVYKNPKKPILDFNDKANIRTFLVIGVKEPVIIRGQKTIFEVYLKEIFRQSL